MCQKKLEMQKILFRYRRYSKEFGNWFSGFSECRGSFVLGDDGRRYFILIDTSSDRQVVNYIRRWLGFGYIVTDGPISYLLAAQDREIDTISMILHARIASTANLDNYNKFFNQSYTYRCRPTLKSSWLSGYLDSQGDFIIKYEANKDPQYIVRLVDSDPQVLKKCKSAFPGLTSQVNMIGDMYELKIGGSSQKELLRHYLRKFPLHSHKRWLYKNWAIAELSWIDSRPSWEKDIERYNKIYKSPLWKGRRIQHSQIFKDLVRSCSRVQVKLI